MQRSQTLTTYNDGHNKEWRFTDLSLREVSGGKWFKKFSDWVWLSHQKDLLWVLYPYSCVLSLFAVYLGFLGNVQG